ELKASETIRDLMNQLEGTENRITVERQRFNESVGDYNTYIKIWPQSIIASRYGFVPREFFQAEEGAEKAPDINLNIDETTTKNQ
ncbi:MAG: LemA family protein, partial [Candidatus Humimicrobiaceae bacterium]